MNWTDIQNYLWNNREWLPCVIVFLCFLLACNRWSYWRTRCNSKQPCDQSEVIKELRSQVEVWKTSSIARESQMIESRKGRIAELESHNRHWRRISDKLLCQGQKEPDLAGLSDEALRLIGSIAAGDTDAGDWLEDWEEELSLDSAGNYHDAAENIITARKG